MPSDSSVNGDNHSEDVKQSHRKDNGVGKDICRDYLNNICNRGSRCKFFHPEQHDNKAQNAAEDPYQFCIDFQNQGCHRDNCRYVHAFREDVERYKRSGDVTLGLARALAALMRGETINGIPLCKEFQNGHCARGSQCRYWHINKDEERRKRFSGRPSGSSGISSAAASPPRAFGAYSGPLAGIRRRAVDEYSAGSAYDEYIPLEKRAATYAASVPGIAPTRLLVDLERRNAELVAEVDSLKRELQREKERYDDLMALFRATQANQTATIQQQQRSVQMAAVASTPSLTPTQQALSQQGISSLGLAPAQQVQQQQQPAVIQQWGGGAGTTAGYSAKYDWTAN